MVSPASTVYVFDTGPLLRVATGLPFKLVSAVSFMFNDYRKLKEKAVRAGKTFLELAPSLRRELVSQVENKYVAGLNTLDVLGNCIAGSATCVIPRQVLDELGKYSFLEDVSDTLKLLESEEGIREVARKFNDAMVSIGRAGGRLSQVVPEEFLQALIGGVDFEKPDLENIRDPEYIKWLNIIRALTSPRAPRISSKFRGLSETDKMILAYTAYLNNIGERAIAVIGDRTMKRLADFLRIPYIYVYDRHPRVRNAFSLGNLQPKPAYINIRTRHAVAVER